MYGKPTYPGWSLSLGLLGSAGWTQAPSGAALTFLVPSNAHVWLHVGQRTDQGWPPSAPSLECRWSLCPGMTRGSLLPLDRCCCNRGSQICIMSPCQAPRAPPPHVGAVPAQVSSLPKIPRAIPRVINNQTFIRCQFQVCQMTSLQTSAVSPADLNLPLPSSTPKQHPCS